MERARAFEEIRRKHQPMGANAPQWCADCSATAETIDQWTPWPCDAIRALDLLAPILEENERLTQIQVAYKRAIKAIVPLFQPGGRFHEDLSLGDDITEKGPAALVRRIDSLESRLRERDEELADLRAWKAGKKGVEEYLTEKQLRLDAERRLREAEELRARYLEELVQISNYVVEYGGIAGDAVLSQVKIVCAEVATLKREREATIEDRERVYSSFLNECRLKEGERSARQAAETERRLDNEHAAAGYWRRKGCDAYKQSPETAYSHCSCSKLPVLEAAERERDDQTELKEQWALAAHEAGVELVAAEERSKRLEEAGRAALHALTLLSQSLRAWATPLAGMGVNIQQESRGKAAWALREESKAREALEAALSEEKGPAPEVPPHLDFCTCGHARVWHCFDGAGSCECTCNCKAFACAHPKAREEPSK